MTVHELGIAMEILRTCEEVLQKEGPGRLEVVRVSVGELTAVEPDLLRFAWEAAVSSSAHSKSRLEVEWKPARQICPKCNEEKHREKGQRHFHCPDSGEMLNLEGGRELGLLEVTFDPLEEEVQS
jgi:hydrogenase nickel incorporation protein HypA/HybF